MTPLHRGYAKFGETNIQPDENYTNRCGEDIDAYINAVKEAGNVWAVPVIDLSAVQEYSRSTVRRRNISQGTKTGSTLPTKVMPVWPKLLWPPSEDWRHVLNKHF